LPFSGVSATEAIDQILHSQPQAIGRYNYEVPLELERIIRKCLEKDPDRRYQSARELVVDLKNLERDTNSGTTQLSAQSGARAKQQRSYGILGAIFAGVILLALGLFLFSRMGAGTTREKSIAVLPFANLSEDQKDSYFSDGMTEDVITQLSKIADLKVISRTS